MKHGIIPLLGPAEILEIMMITSNEKTSSEVEKKPENGIRKPYEKPHLENLGDLRSVTLGGVTGFDDPSGDFNQDDPFT